ncbi:hypothetical protein FSP39_004202 [Pinctada imbricata]|uniref:Uncharacterized protein n=1 Tax=Pinctada imbricata TaxID=66713 RepID=A0AA88YLP5_PINIB|nr:hypothetical protein FSP39_004202 [Pinctada imbricata]
MGCITTQISEENNNDGLNSVFIAICSPQCQNGGTCISPNTCACAPGWRGSFCEQADGLCAQPTAPGNGSIQCRSGSAETRCTINCAPGFKFTFAPAPVYTCTPSTSWSPAPNFPECIPVDQLPDPSATPASHGFTRKAMCAAWGQDHYRTFDNKIFSFQGKCEYVLAKDCDSNTFHIHVINDRTCSQNAPCHRSLDIYMGDTKISLKPEADGPAIYWGDKKLAVPNQREKVVFQKLGHYIIVSNANLGFNIRWDGRETVFVSVAEEMRGKTCGLCGTFDGNKDNDFTTDIGRVVSSVSNFATTWKKSSQIGQDTCPDSPQKTCSSSASAAAQTKCDQLKQGAFLACNSKVDPTAYIESCKSDCCDSVDGQCTCSSFEAYARACMDSGLRSLNWRTAQLCPAKCPSNLVHKECGSSCELACGATSLDTCSGTECTDGCYCPDGMVLNNDTCVRPEQCPCKHGDKYYQPGQTVPKDCNRCTCTSGSWQCTNKRCEATCSATGDPHYMTFDGIRYNFMGICSYQMVQDTQSPDFGVIANNIACGHGHASCTKSITLQYAGHTIEMGHNHELTIDNKLVTKLPYQKKGIKLYMVSSLFMKAELSNGVTILWDGRTRAYITAPTNFFNRTRGMCGTFDHNQNNEFLTKSGDIETDINSFGNKWKLQPLCRDETPGQSTASPCETDAAKKSQADKYCRYLKGDVFSSCHSVVDYTPVYENCMYDVCACTSNLGDCLCPMLGQYAQDCAAQGIDILWRNHIPECHLPCPGGQEYQQCPNECTRSCQNIAKDPNCVQSPRCAEGCGCPANQTLNELGDCIDIDKCPCTFNDQLFPYGSKAQMDGKICTCENARWTCVAPGPTHQHYNVPSICNVNEEYTKCKSECPVTCENMHQPPNCPTPQPDDCEAGCKCKEGYVLEGTQCVKNNSCPCYHGGKAYFDGDKYTADCNECTCKGQQWSCTSKECPAVCSAFGDSHYHTFDGKDFEFQGSCTYVMAKSTAANPHHFQITTENVPCGTSGVACTKSITFTIGKPGTSNYYTLQLIRGKPIIVDANSPFNIQEVGNFFIITTPTGITLTWDKGTRLYIKLSTDHKGQVMGLCGNFDGDRNNDFSTPQGGPVAVNAIAFADSWKVQSYCAKPEQIVDTCVNNSQRKPWAQRKCGIINSDLFEPCHHVVPPANFYSKCLFDACACDTGGDCECLCTAIAAYAHECAVNGMPIAWRTKELCAIQCEDCQTYNPCISACPKKTCDNRLVYDKLTAGCQEICVEGCDIKPCASGEVFDSNIPPMKCIPEPFCNNTACTINGKSYRQNEQIHDSTVCREDCEICYCDAGEIRRNGFCSSTTPTTTRFPPVTYKKTPSPVPGGTGSPTPRPGVGGTGTPTYTKPGGHDGHTTGRSKKPRPTTAPLPTMPPMCVQDGWTGWMSNSYPTPLSPDDMETVPNLRKKYTFCADFQISAIQCRAIGITQDSQQTYTCDARQGLICRSNDQTDGSNVCDDFEVRFFCNCDVTPKPGSYGQPTAKPKPGGQGQPTPSPKTDIFGNPVTYPKPVTDRYGLPTPSPKTDIFGYPVTNPKPATDIFGNPTPSPKTDIFGNPVTNPKPATDIFGNPTPSPKTDIFGNPVTNPKPATDIFGNPTPSPKTDIFGYPVTNPKPATDIFGNPTPSPKTDIFGNPVTYPKPVTDRYGLPTPSPKTDIFGNPVTKKPYSCKEGWSVWMNNDTPTKGQGDFETIASLRYEYSFCAKPQSIQCRTVADKMPVTMSLDGGVICDANVGLVCRNADQSDNSCEDYEVSVYCDCGGSTPEPHVTKSPIPGSTTHIQGVPYAPVPACQWTPWMNSHVKTTAVTGEFETISNLRLMYSFCEYPVKIECRDAASKTPYDKTAQLGVSCDVNRGLLCDDLNQNSASGCLDYEVRVYCADACQTPGSDQQGSPTPSPKTDIFGNPITNPVPGSGQQGSPTPSPRTDKFGKPITNPVPGSGQQGSPTPSPKTDIFGNPITNPVPGSGQQGSPTPSPKTDQYGNPITNPVPGSGQQGSPTPSPKTDIFGNPITNPVPGSGQQGSPTPSPKTDEFGNPITNPVPGSGQQGSPTPSPKTDIYGNPITNPVPGSGQQGSPTPSPKTDEFGNPITNPVPGSGQQGSPTPSPKTDIFGNPITNPVPGSGQQGSPTPSPKTDIFGNPITNPVPGSGQQGSPTPSPKTDIFGNPITNPVPGSGQQGSPTPSPKTDQFGNPITNPVPGSGQQGKPTPSPKTDKFGNPITNPVPGSGQQGSPTPSPKTDQFGNPITNPVPGSGQQGSPTPSPKTDIFGNPITNPVPGSGQQGSPTPSPKTDQFGNPITNPVPGSGQQGSPTPSPKTDEFGNPITNPVPGSGQQGSPTPSPKTDQFGNPITNPVPGSGQQGSPTPSPKTDEFGNPVLTATTKPTPGPGLTPEPDFLCREGWTKWINSNKPTDNDDDIESVISIPGYPDKCHKVIAARCSVVKTGLDYKSTGQDVSCNVNGLVCKSDDQQICEDYQVQYYCICFKPTPAPKTDLFGNPVTIPKPNTGKQGTPTPSPKTDIFGNPIIVSPGTSPQGMPTPSPGTDIFGNPYTLPKPSAGPQGTPTPSPKTDKFGNPVTLSQITLVCNHGWTTQMNADKPTNDGGDFETFTRLRRYYSFCHESDIVAVKCTKAGSNKTASDMNEKVRCDSEVGLECFNKDQQDGMCEDYQIQAYCDCRKSSTPTPSPTPSATPSPGVTNPANTPTVTMTTPLKIGNKACDDHLGVANKNSFGDHLFSASSSTDVDHDADKGRLNGPSAWEARYIDEFEHVQVNLDQQVRISGVKVQGHPSKPYWVTKFIVEFSNNGDKWSPYIEKQGSEPKVFKGNFDQTTPVQVFFDREIPTTYVRIIPKGWHQKIAMRFEVLACTTPGFTSPGPCVEPLGIDNSGMIQDKQLSASSRRDILSGAAAGRLFNEYGAWIPRGNDGKDWIEVDLLTPKVVSGVMTQGSPREERWVTKYGVSYSIHGYAFSPVIGADGKPVIFNGNTDQNKVQKNQFPSEITARYIRITPVESSPAGPGMRFNLIGCSGTQSTASPTLSVTPTPPTIPVSTVEPVCMLSMGVENPSIITDRTMLASSSKDSQSQPDKARLDLTSGTGHAWIPSPSDKLNYPYIEVNFLEPKSITGIVTRGHGTKNLYTKSFRVYTSLDGIGSHYVPYNDQVGSKSAKTFTGNSDKSTPVTNLFNRQVIAKFVRIFPMDFEGEKALQFNVLGCNPTSPPNQNLQALPTPEPKTDEFGIPMLKPGQAANQSTPTPSPKTDLYGNPVTIPKPKPQPFKEPSKVCLTPMGLENVYIVTDVQISASSSLSPKFSAEQGRIFNKATSEHGGAWVPSKTDSKPWIQVDFNKPTLLSGVVIQGEVETNRYVTSYTVSTSVDGKTFTPYMSMPGSNVTKVFKGNADNKTPVRNLFNRNITAQVIRIYPSTSSPEGSAIRFNILGCFPATPAVVTPAPGGTDIPTPSPGQGGTAQPTPKPSCDIPLGITNKAIIADTQLTASSILDGFHGAERGRIYTEKDGSFSGGWTPSINNKRQWIQVDFFSPTEISGILTQGRSEIKYWVTKYQVYYSTDGQSFSPVTTSTTDKTPMVFDGNKDRSTPVKHNFPYTVIARYVRVVPVEWQQAIGLRFELIGCNSPTPSPLATTPSPSQGTTPTPVPQGPATCLYWTPWVNTNTPDKVGDYETAYRLNDLVKACPTQFMKKIECRDVASKKPHDAAGDQDVKCNLDLKGLVCMNSMQANNRCLDYEIRVFCDECGTPTPSPASSVSTPSPSAGPTSPTNTPTPSPGATTPTPSNGPGSSTSTPTPSPTQHSSGTTPCVEKDRWSPWINRDKPSTGGGDRETMTAQELARFCPGNVGVISKIECQTTYGIPSYSSGDVAICDKASGFVCYNSDNFPVDCQDYQIRYLCHEICTVTKPHNNDLYSPKPGQQGTPTPSPKTDQFGNPITNPKPGTDRFGNPTPSPKTDQFGNPVTNPKPGTDRFGNPTPSPKTDQFGNPVTNPKPGTDKYGNPTPSPKTDQYGNPITNPVPGSGQQGTPTPSPKTDEFGNPITNPKPGTDKYGNPTPSPKTDQFGNPVTNPVPGSGQQGSPTPSPKTDEFGNPITNPKPGTDKYGNPTPSPKTDQFGNPVTNPVPGSGQQGSPTPSPKTDQFGKPVTNPVPGSGQQGSPTPSPKTDQFGNPILTRCSQSRWSPWINKDNPDFNGGDREVMTDKEKDAFCADGRLTKIECQTAVDSIPSYSSGEQVTCDRLTGLTCNNADNFPVPCSDYKIRYYCDSVCAPGEVLEQCGHRCNQLCDSMSRLTTTCQQDDNTCVPMCKPAGFACQPGERLKDKNTCVQESLCPCRMQNGTVAKAFESWRNPYDDCEVCHCFNNTVTCTQDTQCVTTPQPTPPKYVKPIIHPRCDWTYWMNVDTPLAGDGDEEIYSALRVYNTFCDGPVEIECRQAGTKVEASLTGQRLTCDLDTGLRCLNWENPNKCHDYEVRFFCPCASTVSPVPGQQGNPTPSPKTDIFGNPVTNPKPITDKYGNPTPSPKTDIFGNPVTNPKPVTDQFGNPTPSPKTDIFGNPVTNPKPGTDKYGNPTPSPKTDIFGNPVTNPKPVTDQFGNPTPSPKTDIFGNPVTNPNPGTDKYGNPTPSPKTDIFGNPVTNPKPGTDIFGNPTPSPKTDIFGNPVTNPKPGTDKYGNPTPSPKTDIFGNPVTNPKPVTDKFGNPTPSPKTDQFGNPVTNPKPGTDKYGNPTPSPKTDAYGNPITSNHEITTLAPTCGWSSWINMDSPYVMKPGKPYGGDIESIAALRESVCRYEMMTKIECRTAETKTPYKQAGEVVSCDRIRGLRCRNSQQTDKKCLDYEVRVYCNCTATPTPSPSSGGTATPTPSPKTDGQGLPTKSHGSDNFSTKPVTKACGWTTWMNGHRPDSTGETEVISKLRSLYKFCDTDEVTAIECRESITGLSSMDAGQDEIVCDVNYGGLVCDNSKQGSTGGQCYDYEIRLLCEPKGVVCSIPVPGQQGTPTPSPKTDIFGNPITNPVPGSGQQGSPTPSPKTDIFGNPITNPVPGSGQQGSPTPSPKTDIFGNPITNPVPGSGQQGSPTPSPKTDIFGNPITNPVPGSGQQGSPTPSPKTDIFGNPITNPVPGSGQQGSPTPSPKTDQYGNPITNPVPGSGQQGSPTPSPKTDQYGNPITNPVPGSGQQGSPTPSPKTDQYGNPITNPVPGSGQQGSPTPSPKTDQYGNPITNPVPGSGQQGSPTPSPKTDQYGNPITNPVPGSGQQGSPTPSPKTDQYGNPITNPVPGSGQQGSPTPSPKTDQYGNPITNPVPGSGQQGSPTPSPKTDQYGNPITNPVPGSGQQGSPTPSPKTDIFGNPITNPVPGSGQQGSPTPSPKTDQYGNPITNPVPGSGQQGSPTPSPKTDQYGNPITNPVPGSGQQGTPTPSPKTDQYGNPITNPVPGSGQQGSPTPSPKTDQYGNPITNPVPGSGQQGSPTPSPKTDQYGNPITNPVPGSGQQGSPTPSPKTDQYGNPITNPVPGSGQQGSPTPSPKTDQYGNPITNPVPGSGQQGSPTPSPKTDQYGNPITNPVPGSGQQGSPTPSPKTDQYGNPITNPVPGSGQQGSPTPSPKTDQYGNPITNPVPGSGQQGSPTPSPKTDQYGNPITNPVPGSGQQGSPTPSPKTDQFGNPVTTPTQAQITTCATYWSTWINENHPSGNGDKELSAVEFQKNHNFCRGGSITKVECYSNDMMAPSTSTGEILKCTVADGLVCNDADNYPVPCTDYKIRYFCDICICVDNSPQTNITVSDDHLSASTSMRPDTGAQRSHPDLTTSGSRSGGWIPSTNNRAQWIMVDFSVPQVVYAVTTQGVDAQQKWVTSYYLMYSNDGKTFTYYQEDAKVTASPPVGTTPTPGQGTTPSATPTPGVGTTPTPTQGTPCVTRWSKWINRDNPVSDDKEVEAWTTAEKQAFCPGGKVNQINCTTVDGTPSYSTGEIASCYPDTGFTCENADNFPIPCSDYKISYFCECTAMPTPSPTPSTTATPQGHKVTTQPSPSKPSDQFSTTPTPPQHKQCKTRWSDWINKDNPTSDDKEHEFWTDAEKSQFCPGGKINKINCTTIDGTPSYSTGEIATCYPDSGFTCNNADNFPIPCSDYKISYFCQCAPTAAPTVGTTPVPGGHKLTTQPIPTKPHGNDNYSPSPTPSPRACKTEWSQWIDKDIPDTDGMEHEYWTYKEKQAFCPGGNVTKIECVTSDGDVPSYSSGEILNCYVDSGLVCNNADNFPVPCSNYKVRYYCQCSASPTLGPTPSPTGIDICKVPMGVKDGTVRNELISASSFRDANASPHKGRLNANTVWMPSVDTKTQYIQVDFLQQAYLTGVTTQGRHGVPTYVTSYYIKYSSDGQNWNTYSENGQPKTFQGNFDSDTPVTHFFTSPVRARYMRINPQTWQGKIALRFEYMGCPVQYPTTAPLPTTPTPKPVTTPTTATSGPTTPGRITDDCIEYDTWVNVGQNTPQTSGDREPIDQVKNMSLRCRTPIRIQCQSATGVPYDQTGQIVTCNLWEGLTCNNADQFDPKGCMDYRVRLGCLKQSPECVKTTAKPTTTVTAAKGDRTTKAVTPLRPCYPGLDTSRCPTCPDGQFCDGLKCVSKDQCTCIYNGKAMRPMDIITGTKCESCQCFGGLVKCIPKTCPDCASDETKIVNMTSCSCECQRCKPDEFRCGNGQCIPAASKCDGVIDCGDDEKDCIVVPAFTPPVIPTPSPKSELQVNPTVTTRQHHDGVTTKRTKPGRTTICLTVKCQPLVRPPVKAGEVLKIVKTDDGCCDRYEAICKPETCNTQPITCTVPKTAQTSNPGECCPQFQCVCPSTCPVAAKPTCKPGQIVTLVDTDCGCTAYACISRHNLDYEPPVCRYTHSGANSTTYKLTQSWTDGPCKSCRCENGTNGSAETVCHTEKCPQCGLSRDSRPDQVNAVVQCKPSGCVVNGHVYKAGESINGSMHCFSKTCSYSAAFDAYIIKETQIECRTDNLPPCKGNTTEYDATGCCKTCEVKPQQAAQTCATCQPMLMFGNPASTIGYFSVINNGVKCENLDPIPDLKECSGYCQSRAKYTAIMRGFDNKCNCCQPTKTISKSVQLTCADGSVISKSYNVPENCGCSACSGGR